MRTAEEIADEIEALNKQYLQEYWKARDAGHGGTGLLCAVTDDPKVLEVLRKRSIDHFRKLGARMARRREKLVFDVLFGVKDDQSFGMAELVNR